MFRSCVVVRPGLLFACTPGGAGKCRALSAQSADLAKHIEESEASATYLVRAGLREAEFGSSALARQDVQQALALSSGRDVQTRAALTLARSGDSRRSQTLVNALDRDYPLDTLVQQFWLPTIRASLALNRGNAQQTISALQRASPVEFSNQDRYLYPVYIRGLAYLRAKQGEAAAAQFRGILAHAGVVVNFPLGALAHVQLARALVIGSETW